MKTLNNIIAGLALLVLAYNMYKYSIVITCNEAITFAFSPYGSLSFMGSWGMLLVLGTYLLLFSGVLCLAFSCFQKAFEKPEV